jgi:hypothetical protein
MSAWDVQGADDNRDYKRTNYRRGESVPGRDKPSAQETNHDHAPEAGHFKEELVKGWERCL